jgi:hypothetical protein
VLNLASPRYKGNFHSDIKTYRKGERVLFCSPCAAEFVHCRDYAPLYMVCLYRLGFVLLVDGWAVLPACLCFVFRCCFGLDGLGFSSGERADNGVNLDDLSTCLLNVCLVFSGKIFYIICISATCEARCRISPVSK